MVSYESSKHFMIADVNAVGLQSLMLLTDYSLGTRMLVADFRQDGMIACVSDRLNILVRTPKSWSTRALNTSPSTP